MAQVSVAADTDKVLPGSGARAATSAALYGAKGETVSFQVVVTGPCTVTDVNVPQAVGPVPTSAIFVFREVWQNCANGSGALDPNIGGWQGRVPDGLMPRVDDVVGEQRGQFCPVTVASGDSLAFWIDLYIPTNAPAGTYGGQAVVSIQGQPDTPASFTLRVWNFAIPATSSLRTFWGCYYPDLPAGFGVSGDALSALRARFAQLALDHRMAVSNFDDGNTNVAHWNSFYLPLVNGTAPTNLPGAKLTTVFSSGAGWDTGAVLGGPANCWNAAVAAGYQARLVQWTVDEPTANGRWGNVAPDNATIKGINAAYKTLVTASIQDLTSNNDLNAVDILCPLINQMHDKGGTYGGNQRAAYNSWVTGNRELWLYQACDSHGCGSSGSHDAYYSGWTSYAIDASMLRARMMGWLIRLYQATGELYYDSTYVLGGGAWTNGLWSFGGQGDGTLFLPGTVSQLGGSTPIVCATLRVKAIRGGYTDFEYLKILDNLGDSTGLTLAQSMFPNPWTQPDQATFAANRITIGNKIEQLLGGAGGGGGSGGGGAGGGGGSSPPTVLSWSNGGVGAFSASQSAASLLHPARVVSKTPTPDQTLNRIQDQITRSVNPALQDMANMPRAKSGVFQSEAWIAATLQGGWQNTAASYPASYLIDAAGNVHLQGGVEGGKIGTAAFVLPVGKRPAATTSRLCVSAGQVAVVTIHADGSVIPMTGSSTGFDFGGVFFRAGG